MIEVKNNGAIDLPVGRKTQKTTNRVSFQAESPADKVKASVTRACERDGGKYISFGGRAEGILIGASSANKEYYFVYINKDRKVSTISASEKYSLLKEIPSDLSVLNYLWYRGRNDLLESVQTQISANHINMETKLYIQAFKPKTDDRRKYKKEAE